MQPPLEVVLNYLSQFDATWLSISEHVKGPHCIIVRKERLMVPGKRLV
jgi:hypothetical protein